MRVAFFLALTIFHLSIRAQYGISWQRCFGGTDYEEAMCVQPVHGGYAVVGYSLSNDGDLTNNQGDMDAWVVRMDGSGGLVWQRSIGGSSKDEYRSVRPTSDGSIVCIGRTHSDDGDIVGSHGNNDILLTKFSEAGDVIWQRIIGGSGSDYGNGLRVLADGGLVLVGNTSSNDGDIQSTSHGDGDIWVVRTDPEGQILWEEQYGGNNADWSTAIDPTPDGGYIVCGATVSTNGQVTDHHNWEDYWIIRIDSLGTLLWQHDLGGTRHEVPSGAMLTSHGQEIAVGFATSLDGDVSGNHGAGFTDNYDAWVVRLDSSGALAQELCYGGTGFDDATAVLENPDGSILVCGYTSSDDGDVIGDTDWHRDIWLFCVGENGSILWQQLLGGSWGDEGAHMEWTQDGGLILCGTTASNDGDVSGNHGADDIWVVKLETVHTHIPEPMASGIGVFPSPASDHITIDLGQQLTSDRTELLILDVFGRVVVHCSPQTLGTFELLLPGYMPPGTYYVQAITESGAMRSTFQLMR